MKVSKNELEDFASAPLNGYCKQMACELIKLRELAEELAQAHEAYPSAIRHDRVPIVLAKYREEYPISDNTTLLQ